MHVLHVVKHGCVRVTKEALALSARGHTIDVASQEVLFGFNHFNTFSAWQDVTQLCRTIQNSSADIIHVHNEPDWVVSAARSATDRPIIFDVHDLESLRWQRAPDEIENAAFRDADGFVHVSDVCLAAAEFHHGKAKPAFVLPCYINEIFYPTPQQLQSTPAWNTIVYEGGLGVTEETTDADGRTTHNFRGLEPVVEAFVGAGYNFHLYPTAARDDHVYENIGAVLNHPLQYPVLVRALRTFGFGFVGAAHSSSLMDAALPNKLFEYLSQGVVPVVLNAARAAKFVTDNGVGIVLENLSNLREQLECGPEIRKNVIARHRDWTMEANIGGMDWLYDQVVERGRARSHPPAEISDIEYARALD